MIRRPEDENDIRVIMTRIKLFNEPKKSFKFVVHATGWRYFFGANAQRSLHEDFYKIQTGIPSSAQQLSISWRS